MRQIENGSDRSEWLLVMLVEQPGETLNEIYSPLISLGFELGLSYGYDKGYMVRKRESLQG